MKRIFTFILLFVFVGATAFAQDFGKQNVDRNGNPTFVKVDAEYLSVAKSETKAILSSLLNMTSNDEYKTMKSEKDQIGYTHEKFQQYYKGIKVVNGVYIVHSRNEVVESVNGDYKLISDINVTPSVSSTQAIENAKAFIDAKVYMKEDKATDSKPELVIVEHSFGKNPKAVNEMVLAYKVDVYATQPLSRDYVYVSAHTGEIVNVNAILVTAVETGSADTRYSGTKSITTDSYSGYYRLRDYSRGNGIITYNCNEGTSYTSAVDFTDANNDWTAAEYDNADKDNGALDAHWAGMVTYDYFQDIHGRNSFDGNNALIQTYVHFDVNYDNAYWNGSVFTFGDGSSFDILTSLDVFGHEFGHAVCTYTADLNYENESGALNEAFSDIWGCVIEYYYAPEKDTWLMGEDLGSALRSLSDPKSKGLPDTYMGDNWYPLAASPTRFNDYGGVHYNNGPYCHWFYLISEGGSGTNDNNDSYSVTAIGIEKAEKIAYRVESVYMTSTSDYADARTYSIQAAQDLYGVDSQEEISVTNAMYAVGVGNEYGGVTPPTECSSTISSFPYSEGFESGIGAWTQSSSDDLDWTVDASGTPSTSTGPSSADEGTYYMYVEASSPNYPSKVAIFNSPCFDLTSQSTADFNFAYHMYGATMGTMELQASTDGTSWTTLWTKSGDQGNTWYDATVSLNSYYGTSVQLRYVATTSTSWTSDFAIDDISVTTTGSGDTEAPTAPTNLSSSNVTETSLTLSWTASTDNVGVTGYDVYQNGSLLGSVVGAGANITGLTAGTTYSYYVKAKDAANNISAASSTINVTTDSQFVDTEAPTVPTGLASSNITTSSATISWNASSDNVGVTAYEVYKDGSLAGTVGTTTYNATGLSAETTYAFTVKAKDAANNVSAASSALNVTTLDQQVVTYCSSQGNSVVDEWIDLVQLNEIDNVTGANGGYADFTNLTANVARGSSQRLYVSCGHSGTAYTEYWHAWIDWDQNGTFDTDERMLYGSSSSSALLYQDFTVPSDAVLGTTGMRVTMKYNSAATSCETFPYGEVEDYTINVTGATFSAFSAGNNSNAEILGNEASTDIVVYPNPASSFINVNVVNGTRHGIINIYNMIGSVVKVVVIDGNEQEIDISDLPKGVYIISVEDEKEPIIKQFIKK